MKKALSIATSHGTLALVAWLAAAPAWSQELASELSFGIVETDAEGKETLVARDTIRPGEVIEYELVSRNLADTDRLESLVVGAPVPEGTTFLPASHQSSVPARFEVQADLEPKSPGLEWSELPAFRTVYAEDGSTYPEPLPASEIVAMRWSFEEPLPAGESARNTYRLRVD